MAREVAKLTNLVAMRCLTLVVGFVLLLHGHHVLNGTSVFGVYMALCMLAMAIVFYQTQGSRWLQQPTASREQRSGASAHMVLQALGDELNLLEREYSEDIKRLERRWL